MATKTLYGIVSIKGDDESYGSLSNSTFRLHVAGCVDDVQDAYRHLLGAFGWVDMRSDDVVIKLEDYPSAGLIYERELHVCKTSDRKKQDVLHLKEGTRFLECTCDHSFILMLIDFFLRGGILELIETIKS